MISLVDAAGRAVLFPTNLQAATPYQFQVRLNGFAPAQSEWSLRQDLTVLAAGQGIIRFTAPVASLALYVRAAMSSSGSWTEAIFRFSSVPRRSVAVEVGVLWSQTFYAESDTLRAKIVVYDPEGLPARSVRWELFKNSALTVSGDSYDMQYSDPGYGVYRLHVVAVDGVGAVHAADSTTYVQGGSEVQATIAPKAPSGTMYHLGDVFLNEMQAAGGVSTELPVVTATLSLSTFLLPGTTHVKFDFVGQVDDEVVVRTPLGNWALVGPPTGFVTERVGYDYALPPHYLPVSGDLCLKVTVDLWNVRGFTHQSSAFTVRVRCFRSGPLLNEYAPCQCANYTGGGGARTRKLALVFSEANLELDVRTTSNRLGSPFEELFTTELVTSFPAVLASEGQPYPMAPQTGFSFSPANLVATYEPERADLAELDAKGSAGIPNVRPFILTFNQADNPHIVQRLKRVGGRVACYISEGAVELGAVVYVGIETSARGRVSLAIPVTASVYADAGTFAKIGEIALELADYDFTPGGLVAHLSIQDKLVTRRGESVITGSFWVAEGVNYRSLSRHQTVSDQQGQFNVVRLVRRITRTQAGQFAVRNTVP